MYCTAFVNFNDYYNRKPLSYATYAEYLTGKTENEDYFIWNAINFNPNDGVDAQTIINIPYGKEPNYLLVTDENDTIISRWYIIDNEYQRNGQLLGKLRRDLISDYKSSILTATSFIEKGLITDKTNSLLYQSEGNQMNQIVRYKTPLKDGSGTPWLVGYASNDMFKTTNEDGKVVYSDLTVFSSNISLSGIYESQDEVLSAYPGTTFSSTQSVTAVDTYYFRKLYIPAASDLSPGQQKNIVINLNGVATISSTATAIGYNYNYSNENKVLSWWNLNWMGRYAATQYLNKDHEDEIAAYDKFIWKSGSYIQVGSGSSTKIYRLSVTRYTPSDTYSNWVQINSSSGSHFYEAVKDQMSQSIYYVTQSSAYGSPAATVVAEYLPSGYYCKWTDVTSSVGALVTIPTNIQKLKNSPYYMFAVPYNDCEVYTNDSTHNTCAKEQSRNLMRQLVTQLGSKLYDVQLLPWCPIKKVCFKTGGSKFGDGVNVQDNLVIGKDYVSYGTNGFIIFCGDNVIPNIDIAGNSSTITACNNFYSTNDAALTDYEKASKQKINAMCTTVRIASPDYSAYYDYNIAKNNTNSRLGTVVGNMTCKPYNPLVCVAPEWSNLYANNPKSEGMISSSNYGWDIVTDQWVSYELNNKNYQLTFDRQIKTLDIQNAYGLGSDIISAVTGATGAGIGAGLMTGNAAVGIGAGVASLGAGIADTVINEKLRQETKSAAIDNFNYNIGNIKAQPNTLSKVSCVSNIFEYWPMLIVYDATDTERTALQSQIDYRGMSVGIIGKIEDYDGLFIRGKLIRLEGQACDTHTLSQINSELEMGVYI